MKRGFYSMNHIWLCSFKFYIIMFVPLEQLRYLFWLKKPILSLIVCLHLQWAKFLLRTLGSDSNQSLDINRQEIHGKSKKNDHGWMEKELKRIFLT